MNNNMMPPFSRHDSTSNQPTLLLNGKPTIHATVISLHRSFTSLSFMPSKRPIKQNQRQQHRSASYSIRVSLSLMYILCSCPQLLTFPCDDLTLFHGCYCFPPSFSFILLSRSPIPSAASFFCRIHSHVTQPIEIDPSRFIFSPFRLHCLPAF